MSIFLTKKLLSGDLKSQFGQYAFPKWWYLAYSYFSFVSQFGHVFMSLIMFVVSSTSVSNLSIPKYIWLFSFPMLHAIKSSAFAKTTVSFGNFEFIISTI